MHRWWLATRTDRGNVRYTGPVTGREYVITPTGTPVHEYDYEPMLRVIGPPCCGKTLPPWVEGVRIFYSHTASTDQATQPVPEWLYSYDLDDEVNVSLASAVELDENDDNGFDSEILIDLDEYDGEYFTESDEEEE